MKPTIEVAREAGMSFRELFGGQRIIDGWLADLERFEAFIRADERDEMVALATEQEWSMREDDPFEDYVREIADMRVKVTP
jgi:hypothetical protein